MSEGALQDAIRLELGREPALALFRNNIGTADIRGRFVRFGVGGPGGADLIGVFRGRFVALEVKTTRGRQTAEQQMFQQLIERKGGEYAVLRSVEDARSWLESMRGKYADHR